MLRTLPIWIACGCLLHVACDAAGDAIAEQPERAVAAVTAASTARPPVAPAPVAATSDDAGAASAEPAPDAPPAIAGPTPLSPAQRSALAQVREERIFGSPLEHFTVSNEYRHDLWLPFLRGLGGVYVGVASDQNYTLIAAARSEVAFLVDLDRQVVDLHRIYAALLAIAPDPAAFLALFEPRARKTAREAIASALAGEGRELRARAQAFFEDHRESLAVYLQHVRAEQAGSWLADADAYTYVREMFAAGRIRVLQGNLTGKATMADIAESARALALPVTVLYLSNAEDYLFYTDRFAANVRALPASAESVLLRTIHDRFAGWESSGEGDARWNYQVQPLADFQRRLEDRAYGRNQDRTSMLTVALAEGVVERRARGLSVLAAGREDRSGRRDLLVAQGSSASSQAPGEDRGPLAKARRRRQQ